MKRYKNDAEIKIVFSQIFVALFAILLIINIANEIRHNDFKNIKYYIMILVPCVYVIIFLSMNYYRKIFFNEKSIFLKKIISKKKINYYEILEINKPNIVTVNRIIKLYPYDEYFWEEIKEKYLQYYENNIEYFNETKDIYAELLEIKYEINNEEMLRNMKIRVRQSIFVAVFIWIIYLGNYLSKKELYKEYAKIKSKLKKYIDRNRKKPGFA